MHFRRTKLWLAPSKHMLYRCSTAGSSAWKSNLQPFWWICNLRRLAAKLLLEAVGNCGACVRNVGSGFDADLRPYVNKAWTVQR